MGHIEHGGTPVADLFTESPASKREKLDNFPLEHFLPRMCKGSVLAFDEINNPWRPGETTALLNTLGVSAHAIRQFPGDPNISYIVL